MSFPPSLRCGPSRPRTDRGSAVITVLILAAVTAVIAAGFISRSAQEAKLANRSFYQAAALNLAEAGIEEGLFALNSSAYNTANGWSVASDTATSYVKTITGLALAQGTGSIYVRIDTPLGPNSVVIAVGVADLPRQPRLVKQLRVNANQRHIWANGMVAKGRITFSGNNVVDAYDSSLGPYNSGTNRSDHATVSTTNTDLDPLNVSSNASIYGYVATGGGMPTVGPGGRIYGATTPSGTLVDPTRIRTDFTANLPDITPPTGTATSITVPASITLPLSGDTPGPNGRYLYTTTALSVSGNNTVSITGPVDLIVTGDIAITGNAMISITGSTASMNLYCPGTINIAGNGMQNNTNVPAAATIWGTATSSSAGQAIKIAGNGQFTGTLYAPNGAVALTGNGDTNGAIVCKNLTAGGNGQFHYDVQLAKVTHALFPYRPVSWTELTTPPGGGGPFARDSRPPFAGLF